MDDLLIKWCRDSLAVMRQRLCGMPGEIPPAKTDYQAECAIGLAAFAKLLQSRWPHDRSSVSDCLLTDGCDPTTMEFSFLVNTCPVERQCRPEVLGSIHEYLVSLRGLPLKGPRRSSLARHRNGVFYTPRYVVNEIVRRTIDLQLNQPETPKSAGLQILDPASGCGAFLIVALETLIQKRVERLVSIPRAIESGDVIETESGWRLSYAQCQQILFDQLFGVDLDQAAIEVTQRTLWVIALDSCATVTLPVRQKFPATELGRNFKCGNALTGEPFCSVDSGAERASTAVSGSSRLDWSHEFPQVAKSGGFDIVIGNPPYRRERAFKRELDEIGVTPLGQRFRAARMDLWHYFFYRGIQLLKPDGRLSFITTSYWIQGTVANPLIQVLRDEVQLEELFLLRNQPVFPHVSGQHVIFRIKKTTSHDGVTTIKTVPRALVASSELFFTHPECVQTIVKTRSQLFRSGRFDIMPVADRLLEKLECQSRLSNLGMVRQGIAENPATINRRTIERFPEAASSEGWRLGEGVFSLKPNEAEKLAAGDGEQNLLRPYHDLCDLDRYWVARQPSRKLIYSTRLTCPEIHDYPILQQHLSRFRPVLDSRRETLRGHNGWWQLHWPRDERIWSVDKLVILQMAVRPSVVPVFGASYFSFSVNVFIRSSTAQEDLRYLSALLNSRVLWCWFDHRAKRRGVGLELNGHVLNDAPIRRIDFDDLDEVRQHDQLVALVDRRLNCSRVLREHLPASESQESVEREIFQLESQMDSLVATLYGLDEGEFQLVNELTAHDRF